MADNEPYTRIPNALLDAIALLSEVELRMLLVVARKTIGWQKECDPISLTQFEQATGMSRPAVNETLQRLLKNNYLERTGKGKRGVGCYRLGVGLVNLVNQLTEATSKVSSPDPVNSVNQTSPGLVNSVNTQKKDLKEKKEKREKPPAQVGLDFMHEGAEVYRRIVKRKLEPAMATLIANTVTDIPLWEKCITNWVQAGHNPGNVKGMTDWYNDPKRMENRNGTHQPKRPPNRQPERQVRTEELDAYLASLPDYGDD